jgi:hypothetical protein
MPLPQSISEVPLAYVAVGVLVASAFLIFARARPNTAISTSGQKQNKRQRRKKKATRGSENDSENQHAKESAPPSESSSAQTGKGDAERRPIANLGASSAPGTEHRPSPKPTLVPTPTPSVASESNPKPARNKAKKGTSRAANGQTSSEPSRPSYTPTGPEDMLDRDLTPEIKTTSTLRVAKPEERDDIEWAEPEEGWSQVKRSSKWWR